MSKVLNGQELRDSIRSFAYLEMWEMDELIKVIESQKLAHGDMILSGVQETMREMKEAFKDVDFDDAIGIVAGSRVVWSNKL